MSDLLRKSVTKVGRYELFYDEKDNLRAYRNGVPWQGFDKNLTGIKLISEMMTEILELRIKIGLLETYTVSIEDLEWSSTRSGQGSGSHGSGNDGIRYASCPCCGQLQLPNGEFYDTAVGHLNTCGLAKALGAERNPPILGTQESLAL